MAENTCQNPISLPLINRTSLHSLALDMQVNFKLMKMGIAKPEPKPEDDLDEDEIRRRMMNIMFHNAAPNYNILSNHRVFHTLERGLTQDQISWLRAKREDILDGYVDERPQQKQ